MRKSLHLLWVSALSACLPLMTKDGCALSYEEQDAWETAVKQNTAKAYKAYLSQYPEGCYVDRAAQRLSVVVTPPPVNPVKPKTVKVAAPAIY
jgi:hypothetical protein